MQKKQPAHLTKMSFLKCFKGATLLCVAPYLRKKKLLFTSYNGNVLFRIFADFFLKSQACLARPNVIKLVLCVVSTTTNL